MSKVGGAITRAINRFERAVDALAFLGSIPADSEDAIAARQELETEYRRARELLEQAILRRMSQD